MAFEPYEESRTLGEPDTLYRFTVGSTIIGYTDAENAVSFNSATYAPIPIDRDGVTTSGSLDKTTLKIRLPHDSDIAELFRIAPPSEVVGVTIFQGHAGADFLAVYSGRVMGCGREDSLATLNCEPISTAMKRPGLRRNYMYGCPHALYGDQCGVNRDAFSWDRYVAVADSNILTLQDGWEGSYPASKYVGGIVQWTHDGRTELRTILRASSVTNRITMNGNSRGVGSIVRLSLGCDHKLLNGGDCGAVFNNALNYGGQPWIPTENPISSGASKFY